jgi:hypothetical protein
MILDGGSKDAHCAADGTYPHVEKHCEAMSKSIYLPQQFITKCCVFLSRNEPGPAPRELGTTSFLRSGSQ